MLHTITKRLETCIDINIEISEVDHYTWIFTSRIFGLALEITALLSKYFFIQMAYKLLLRSRKLNKGGREGGTNKNGSVEKNFEKDKWVGDPRVAIRKIVVARLGKV